ncbi:hypothetical protein CTAYLR_006786 [Chrysophaeum taylorii]|uniref:alpha-1,2-Mannosidase n=1 Tax=Chrysophaeum taylorii TaxID=2483200 RepID=A0AAD7U6M5_9STRA|nr:hypothetical protein CTAYLR_006786 [Chrysophaeum taylorii]
MRSILRTLAGMAVVVEARRVVGLGSLEERLRLLEDSCYSYHPRPGEWWGYTWCHRRDVKQFHESEDDETRVEYSLGAFSASKTSAEKAKRGVASTHVFVDGDVCVRPRAEDDDEFRRKGRNADASKIGAALLQQQQKTRRQATVTFACCRNASSRPGDGAGYEAKNERRYVAVWVASVRESRPCEYDITVCTRALACAFDEEIDFPSAAAAARVEKKSRRGTDDDDDDLRRMSAGARRAYRDAAKRMFVEAYDAYMRYAFPAGELRPVTCQGGDLDLVKVPAVTLIDALDTLAVMGNATEFRRAVSLVTAVYAEGFDIDANVSVFETNIRVLGGLLSAHALAADEDAGLAEDYDGGLLKLAVDLGWRLMPAFETTTGIPYGTVNLRYGVPRGETTVASLAGGGSLSLELSVLSALSGEPAFGIKGRGAARALYERRSASLGLLGKHINVQSGKWVEALSGIGSNSDSFYEYLVKSYALFGDDESWAMFSDAYEAVVNVARRGDWYSDVDMFTGKPRRHHFENLQAFWPGVEVFSGDVASAARSLNAFYLVFADWVGLPEDFDFGSMQLFASSKSSHRSPLRPELLESTYILHRATSDPSWLWAAARALEALEAVNRAPCGFAALENAALQTLDDEMPSFFLAETAKYLYLIFEPDNLVDRGDYVFSTEAHLFSSRAVRAALAEPPAADQEEEDEEARPPSPTRLQQSDQQQQQQQQQGLVRRGLELWRRISPFPRLPDDDVAGPLPRRSGSNDGRGVKNVNAYSAASAAKRCARLEWWESAAYDPDFDDVLESRPTRRRRDQRVFFSPSVERHHCLASDDDDDDEESSISIKTPLAGSSKLWEQVGRAQVVTAAAREEKKEEDEDLGPFRFEIFADGFHVRNEGDGEVLEISSVGPSLAQASSTIDDDAVVVTVDSDGLEIACALEISRGLDRVAVIPCTVAAFGATAAVATSADVEDQSAELIVADARLVFPGVPDNRGCAYDRVLYPPDDKAPPALFVVRRGTCLFEDKARLAERAGAAGLVVINSVPGLHRFVMASNTEDDNEDDSRVVDVAAVMISRDDGAFVESITSEDDLDELRATLRVLKRPLSSDSVLEVRAAKNGLHVWGRGDWGVFVESRSIDAPDAPAEWQLFITRRPPCDLPSVASDFAFLDTGAYSAPLRDSENHFALASEVRRCKCVVENNNLSSPDINRGHRYADHSHRR